jgi:hypothetical protein
MYSMESLGCMLSSTYLMDKSLGFCAETASEIAKLFTEKETIDYRDSRRSRAIEKLATNGILVSIEDHKDTVYTQGLSL